MAFEAVILSFLEIGFLWVVFKPKIKTKLFLLLGISIGFNLSILNFIFKDSGQIRYLLEAILMVIIGGVFWWIHSYLNKEK